MLHVRLSCMSIKVLTYLLTVRLLLKFTPPENTLVAAPIVGGLRLPKNHKCKPNAVDCFKLKLRAQ